MAIIRANVSLLLDRLRQVREGAVLACRRRGLAAREETRKRWGRRAHWMARVTGSKPGPARFIPVGVKTKFGHEHVW